MNNPRSEEPAVTEKNTTRPPHHILTTVVGSYPTPRWLEIARNRTALRDAVLAVVKTQELAGLDVVSDGELTRWDVNHPETNGMIDYFVRPLAGVRTALTAVERAAWRERAGTAFRASPPGVVVGPIGPGTLDLAADWSLFQGLTERRTQFTVTSPYMLARTLHDEHYGDLEALTLAIADVLRDAVAPIEADILQVDEAHLPGRPADAALAANAINRVLAGARGNKAVHLCFGNYGGQTVQGGAYDGLIAFLNALDADHVVLEMARRPERDLEALAAVNGPGLGIGVIDIKDNQVETPDEVARRIERAHALLGPDRLRYVHPDCGFWMLPRSVADAKMHALVAGRDLFEGR